MTDSAFGYGPTRFLGSPAFCLGLVLVVVAGAGLFTGNTLIVMAGASGEVATSARLRDWALLRNRAQVWTSNFAAGPRADSIAAGLAGNLLSVPLGNIVGGGMPVALVYWAIYLRPLKYPGRGDAGANRHPDGGRGVSPHPPPRFPHPGVSALTEIASGSFMQMFGRCLVPNPTPPWRPSKGSTAVKVSQDEDLHAHHQAPSRAPDEIA